MPGFHVFDYRQDVDGRDKPGHDGSIQAVPFVSGTTPDCFRSSHYSL
jgi:hypothetical protein